MADPKIESLPQDHPLTVQFSEQMKVFAGRVKVAQSKGLCVICEEPATWYSEAGRREYWLSGTCEPCFDRMFAEPEDEGHIDDNGNVV